MKTYEVRYTSEMLGTRALYGTYSTVEAALKAANAFYDRCIALGQRRLAESIKVG